LKKKTHITRNAFSPGTGDRATSHGCAAIVFVKVTPTPRCQQLLSSLTLLLLHFFPTRRAAIVVVNLASRFLWTVILLRNKAQTNNAMLGISSESDFYHNDYTTKNRV
jgi:hypothetical protein